MKITAIKTAATSGHGMHLWVRVETDEGITGLGECVHGGTQAIAIIQYLTPKLLGRDHFTFQETLELDLRYVRERSLKTDFVILLGTVWLVLTGKSVGV